MNEYDIGDVVRVYTSTPFKVSGTATDPTTTTVKVRKPAGTTTTYTYGTDVELVKDATGTFHIDITPAASEHGVWTVRFKGTGAAVAAEEHQFRVRQSDLA